MACMYVGLHHALLETKKRSLGGMGRNQRSMGPGPFAPVHDCEKTGVYF